MVIPYVNEDNIVVIPNPIPDIDTDTLSTTTTRGHRILYLAHLIQRKGYPLLIQAFANLASRYPDCRLIFAGSAEVDVARRLCAENGIEDRVDFLGWIKDPQRSRELQQATIFVLPSYQEGLPMGVLEAMAYGLAVVTTPVGGIGDVIQHGVNGLLVPPGDASELTAALADLMDDAELCRRLGIQAREDVNCFRAEQISGQWIGTYRDVLSAKANEIVHDY
jgi:glycosyltransferase involved in cell wall biosynthesis